jgi:hypothetical protein
MGLHLGIIGRLDVKRPSVQGFAAECFRMNMCPDVHTSTANEIAVHKNNQVMESLRQNASVQSRISDRLLLQMGAVATM